MAARKQARQPTRTDETGPDWDNLRQHIESRLTDLDMRWLDFQNATGMSSSYRYRLLTAAAYKNLQPKWERAIERTLRWERGSCKACLRGGEPTLLSGKSSGNHEGTTGSKPPLPQSGEESEASIPISVFQYWESLVGHTFTREDFHLMLQHLAAVSNGRRPQA